MHKPTERQRAGREAQGRIDRPPSSLHASLLVWLAESGHHFSVLTSLLGSGLYGVALLTRTRGRMASQPGEYGLGKGKVLNHAVGWGWRTAILAQETLAVELRNTFPSWCRPLQTQLYFPGGHCCYWRKVEKSSAPVPSLLPPRGVTSRLCPLVYRPST